MKNTLAVCSSGVRKDSPLEAASAQGKAAKLRVP